MSSLSFWLFRLLAALSEGLRLLASEEVRPSSVLIGPPLTCPSPPPLLIEIPYCRLDSWRFSWGENCKKCCPSSPWWGKAIRADSLLAKSYSLDEGWRHLSVWFSLVCYFDDILVMVMVQNIAKGTAEPRVECFCQRNCPSNYNWLLTI